MKTLLQNIFSILIILTILLFASQSYSKLQSLGQQTNNPYSFDLKTFDFPWSALNITDSMNTTPDQSKSSPTSDSRKAYNAFHVSLLGYGIAYSVGFERLFTNWLGINAEASVWSAAGVTFAIFPIYLSLYLGGSHRFYLDGGVDILSASVSNTYVKGTAGLAGIGYNFNPKGGGFYFKVGPILFYNNRATLIYFGLKGGYSF